MALYLEHFGLDEPPFRITPHTDFFFDGADRGATLEGLMYAILHDEGIVKVSGEIGSGKTTLCRVLMERLPAEVETVFLANPSYSRSEILHAIAEELGRPPAPEGATPSALRDLQALLIELYASGRRVVVLIDEAHAMPEDTLEQVRLLSNLESSRHKLLQIVLFGQPELDQALAKPSLRQLKDRITHSFRTRPLTEPEIAKYVSFRMRLAGYKGPEVFSAAAIAAISRASSGLTRRINVLSDKSLLAAFAANGHAVTPREVKVAIADSDFSPIAAPSRSRFALTALGLVALGAVAGAGILRWLDAADRTPPARSVAAAAPAPALAAPAAPVSAAPASSPAESPIPAAPAGQPINSADGAAKPAAVEPPQTEPPPPPPPPSLSQEQLRRFGAYSPGASKLLRERLAATREKLQAEPDASHAIELFVADKTDPMRTERFLLRAKELVPMAELYVIPVAAGGKYQLRVVYGSYPDRGAAAAAMSRLPPKYQNAFELAPRSFAELRASI